MATTLLALSGPVALLAWLGGKRADRAQLERVRDAEMEARILEHAERPVADLKASVKDAYVSKSFVNYATLMAGVVALAFVLNRRERNDDVD